MRKEMQKRIMTIFMALLCSLMLINSSARADENSPVILLEINKQPTVTTYRSGENLNLNGMEVTAYFAAGGKKVVTDYTLEGYDMNRIGNQTVTVSYGGKTASFSIQVLPGKVRNLVSKGGSNTSITLTWDAIQGVKGYDVYARNDETNRFERIAFAEENTITFEYGTSMVKTFYVGAVAEIDGVVYSGELSDRLAAATGPGTVTGLTATEITSKSATLSWTANEGATGYIIYRALTTSKEFIQVGKTTGNTYTDQPIASGTAYRYRVAAYYLEEGNVGNPSEEIKVLVRMANPILKVKGGDGKVRLTWNRVNSADFFDIYYAEEGKDAVLAATMKSDVTSYVIDGLTNDMIYDFYVTVRSNVEGQEESVSNKINLIPTAAEPTSSTPKLFADDEEFKASDAFTGIEFFGKNVKLNKSFVIPGVISTNVGGFVSTAMCPQGLTVAGDYLLMTAYDMAREELSVIYVMSMKTRELITTMILPVNSHAGGLGFDGQYLWVSMGTRIGGFSYNQVEEAVASGKEFAHITFDTEQRVGLTASYITYYDGMLWVGSYNELKETTMQSYRLDYTNGPKISHFGTITMPTRVQGVAFTEDGHMIISRSCQMYAGLRGYMRQLDVHKPDLSSEEGEYILGKALRVIEMPTMNEEIAISGGYLYVAFESAAFEKASYPVDRIAAFKLSAILPKKSS